MVTIKQTQLIEWLKNITLVIRENKDILTALDSEIGDADHGFNMERGFNKVSEKIDELSRSQDIAMLMKNTGMTLISSIGGASGPLYGTFFMQAGAVLGDKTEITLTDLKNSIENGVKGVKDRGRASVGDKTMIDVLEPAVQSLSESVGENLSLEQALSNMVDVAKNGMKSTIDMIAKKGRASYLGERSIGHQDAGATSSYLILKALKETIN
ncbi:dihydroxyacetone kinase DhaL subunit [Roseivirga ehrenbergii]|uniref:Dihydroxyacetone kinase n=1 Tax=Roseivirga ehrenbergii (strain DSM 102268 / JCM 13514 / KCTC 12282 / NCIMB 14502 / KMM 6017) TaxID=279360 RepID=A0A150X7F4_ROSEK|nr:dihydroxyacetone kinase subunit DhaL [Roseivirga ehrenbergii]KYG74648.1 dihydroxyacetone kinase [Roseivirga ehrenbergii]TCL14030.1 dihydroxyacetone kinase DhaL subunit [Roseivirga ehrenbergii]